MYYDRANLFGSVIACGCSISTVRWKYSLFLLFSPWRDPRLRHFAGYPFGASRKKTSTIFYNTAINIMSIPIYRDVYRIFFWRWIPFLNLRRNGALSWLTGSVEFLFSILKNKTLSICYGCSYFIFIIWWKYSFYLLSRHWGSYLNFTGYPFGILNEISINCYDIINVKIYCDTAWNINRLLS